MMELQSVRPVGKKDEWRPEPNLEIDSDSFPAVKNLGIKENIRMEIIGDVTNYRKNKSGRESYTIKIKKLGVVKNDSKQIKAKSMAENEGGK